MTASTRTLAVILATVAAVAAFWLLAMGPKRERASELGTQAESLQAKVAEHKQATADGLQARRDFPVAYQQLVLLGKAVPEGDDSASFLVQVNEVAHRAGVEFRQLEVDSTAAVPVAPPPAPVAGEPTTTEPVGEPGATTTAATTAVATEAAAAALPIGAVVGPAGLGVLPYKLQFKGDFFEIADFLQGLDRLVKTEAAHVAVDGRLVTIAGFSLSQDKKDGLPSLVANLVVTTYVISPDQGLTAGATPVAPAAATATPTSTTPTP